MSLFNVVFKQKSGMHLAKSMQHHCNSGAISLQKLCGLALKSAMVLGQNYGSFGAKVRHFWQQSVVVLV